MKIKHIKQGSETTCGAAALAMVYDYLGIEGQNEESVWQRLRVERPGRAGEYFIRSHDMAADGQSFGLSFFIAQADMRTLEGAMQPIKEFLSLGVPVIVCQRISETNPLGHFRVVTGINSEGEIELNDPMKNTSEIMSPQTFMQLWLNANNGEVVGGQFIAIFKKGRVKKNNSFRVLTFHSSINSFTIFDLDFI